MVHASPETNAGAFEHLVSSQVGIPLELFALYHSGKPLQGLTSLSSLSITAGSMVELKLRGRGGGCANSKSRENTDGVNVSSSAFVPFDPSSHAVLRSVRCSSDCEVPTKEVGRG